IRLRPVVVHAQAAADVHVLEAGALLHEPGVDARGLVQGAFHDSNVGDLAAEMEVKELEAVLHAVGLQLFEALADLGDREAEFGAVPSGRLPAATASRRQLHAHADLGPDPNLARIFENQAELGVFLDDWDDAAAHLVGQHRHLDEFSVLEPITDDGGVVVGHRHDGEELRLGARLETELVGPAEIEHFLDNLPLLVHLDRVDAEILAFVGVRLNGRLKRAVNVREALSQEIAEANQDRQPDAAKLQMIDQLLQVDRAIGVLRRMNADVTVGTDRKEVLAPAIDLVVLGGVRNGPGISLSPRAGRSTGRTHARIINQITECTEAINPSASGRSRRPSPR